MSPSRRPAARRHPLARPTEHATCASSAGRKKRGRGLVRRCRIVGEAHLCASGQTHRPRSPPGGKAPHPPCSRSDRVTCLVPSFPFPPPHARVCCGARTLLPFWLKSSGPPPPPTACFAHPPTPGLRHSGVGRGGGGCGRGWGVVFRGMCHSGGGVLVRCWVWV